MAEADLVVLAVVLIFSLVQSIFGMGLLVFGTPTLLLIGFSFSDCLAYLLPASIAISLLQVKDDARILKTDIREFFVWSILPLFVSLALVLDSGSNINISLAVGVLMLLSVLTKLSDKLETSFSNNVKNNFHFYLVTMGIIHGVSNLGGSVLSVLSSAKYSKKEDIRRFISFCYLWFAIIQLVVLSFFYYERFSYISAVVPAISSLVYIIVGKYMFKNINANKYNKLFAVFMLIYSLLLITKGGGIW